MQGRVLSAQWHCNPTLSLAVEIRGEQRFAGLKLQLYAKLQLFVLRHSVIP